MSRGEARLSERLMQTLYMSGARRRDRSRRCEPCSDGNPASREFAVHEQSTHATCAALLWKLKYFPVSFGSFGFALISASLHARFTLKSFSSERRVTLWHNSVRQCSSFLLGRVSKRSVRLVLNFYRWCVIILEAPVK